MDTTAKEGYGVSLGRPLVLQKMWGMVLVGRTCEYHSGGDEYGVIRETCGYHSRLEGYGVSQTKKLSLTSPMGEACVNGKQIIY